jgi:hypothetical protein
MEWFWAGGELLVGIVALVLWWMALKLLSRGANAKLTNMRFVGFPIIFLLWGVGGVILVLRGVGFL